MVRNVTVYAAVACLLASAAGCSDVVVATTGAGATTGTGDTTTGTSGATTGTGAGGGMVCTPGAEQSCYTGPAETEGVGICAPGTATCNGEGSAFGPCEGEVVPAFDDCTTPDDENCDAAVASCSGGHLWSKRFGDAAYQVAASVATDAAGNVLVTGWLSGTVDFGGGALSSGLVDVFVAKLAPNGDHLFSKRFGVMTDEFGGSGGNDVATDAAGNILVTGGFQGTLDFGGGPLTSGDSSDIFVAKLDPEGDHLWSKRFSGAWQKVGNSVATDAAGNVLVTGYFGNTLDFGDGPLTTAGGSDVFVAKLDADGDHVWSKRFGSAGLESAAGLATDAAGNVLVTGHFTGTVDFGGGPLTTAGGAEVFVVKLDTDGDHVWSKRFGGPGTQDGYGFSVSTDSAGNVVVTGLMGGTMDFGGGPLTTAGARDVFVAKLDADGDHLWSKQFGDADSQKGTSVAIDSAGDVFVTGRFAGTVDFGGGPLMSAGIHGEGFVAKLDPAGSHLWSKQFNSASDTEGPSIATDAAGNALLTGQFEGSVDFGGGLLTSAGAHDIFLAKLAP